MKDPAERAKILRELLCVLLVGVLPMIVIGATLFSPSAEEPPPPFYQAWVTGNLRGGLMLGTYLLFFLAPAIAIARSGEGRAHFGMKWGGPGEWRWAMIGFLLNYVTGWMIWWLYRATNFPLGVESVRAFHYFHVSSFGEMVSTWPYYALVILAEEQMARCYLITRFMDLTGNKVVSVLAAATLFCGWHTFWGAAGMLHVFKAGVVFGWMFVRRGNGSSPAMAHFIYDGLALLPR